eukprot:m.125211 g.125211  ORF g.125211 m.125211 type:complete len:367 (-) comp15612_c0_seq7:109-1209(-)
MLYICLCVVICLLAPFAYITVMARDIYSPQLISFFSFLFVFQSAIFSYRHDAWKWTLVFALVNLVVVLPLQTSKTLAASVQSSARGQWTITAMLYAIYLLGFIFLEQNRSLYRLLSVPGAISRIGMVGVATIAVLSGSGAVYTPFKFVNYFREEVSQYQIDLLEQQLGQSRSLLSQKQQQRARKVSGTSALTATHQQARQRSLFWSSESPEAAGLRLLDEDIQALEAVNEQMSANLQELKQARDSFFESSTLKGRIQHIIGLWLSAYCVFKVITSSISVIFGLTKNTDPVSRGMQIAVTWIGLDIDVERWSQQFSFLLVGMIVVASTRNMLLKMIKAVTWVSSSGKLRDAVVFFLVQIMVSKFFLH